MYSIWGKNERKTGMANNFLHRRKAIMVFISPINGEANNRDRWSKSMLSLGVIEFAGNIWINYM